MSPPVNRGNGSTRVKRTDRLMVFQRIPFSNFIEILVFLTHKARRVGYICAADLPLVIHLSPRLSTTQLGNTI